MAGSMMDSFSERYEELRVAYRARLAVELAGLRALASRVALPESDPAAEAALADEIRRMAHRMAGAAGMFQAPSIAEAADLLEDAAAPARQAAGASRTGLCQALDDLIREINAFGVG